MNREKVYLKRKIQYRLASKLVKRVTESCLWQTFYQMDFMKS